MALHTPSVKISTNSSAVHTTNFRINLIPSKVNAVNARTAAYNVSLTTGDMRAYKAASYGVLHVVRDAKCQYREHVESRFHQGDTRSMWHGLLTITDCSLAAPSLNLFSPPLTLWHTAATAKDKGRLQHVIHSTEKVNDCNLPCLQDMYSFMQVRQAIRIATDSSPGHKL